MIAVQLPGNEAQFIGLCIQAGAIFASLLAATLVIYWNIRIARRRATLDILLNEETHEAAITSRTIFASVQEQANLKKSNLLEWLDPSNVASKEAEAIRAVLNRYELVAIGIRHSTLDGSIYKRWCRTTLVDDWISVKSLVEKIRAINGKDTYFCEFERLARQWAEGDERQRV